MWPLAENEYVLFKFQAFHHVSAANLTFKKQVVVINGNEAIFSASSNHSFSVCAKSSAHETLLVVSMPSIATKLEARGSPEATLAELAPNYDQDSTRHRRNSGDINYALSTTSTSTPVAGEERSIMVVLTVLFIFFYVVLRSIFITLYCNTTACWN